MEELFANLFQKGIDAYLIFDGPTRRYFSGFDTSFGCIVLKADRRWFITDPRYKIAAQEAAGERFEVVITEKKDLYPALAGILKKLKTIAVQEDKFSHSDYKELKKQLPDHIFSDGSVNIARTMAVKSEAEIGLITASLRLNELALETAVRRLRLKDTERDLQAEYIYQAYKSGAEGLAFPPIFAFGENAARPHHKPSDRQLRKGEFIVADCGVVLGGYCSDLTRVFCIGEPSAKMANIYDIVLSAQGYALSNIKAGMTCHEADSLAREYIVSNGYGAEFGHGTGHGVGVNIHELPSLRSGVEEILEPGMVITVEPGIYIEDLGGVRIEDMAVVRRDGIVNITKFKKSFGI